jgi:hypothetical protein
MNSLPSDQDSENSDQEEDALSQEASPEVRPRSLRPTRMHGAPARLVDFYISRSFVGIVSSQNEILEDPKSYSEAMQSPQADKWKATMQTKYDSLIKAGTWKLVPLSKGRKVVRCNGFFETKKMLVEQFRNIRPGLLPRAALKPRALTTTKLLALL